MNLSRLCKKFLYKLPEIFLCFVDLFFAKIFYSKITSLGYIFFLLGFLYTFLLSEPLIFFQMTFFSLFMKQILLFAGLFTHSKYILKSKQILLEWQSTFFLLLGLAIILRLFVVYIYKLIFFRNKKKIIFFGDERFFTAFQQFIKMTKRGRIIGYISEEKNNFLSADYLGNFHNLNKIIDNKKPDSILCSDFENFLKVLNYDFNEKIPIEFFSEKPFYFNEILNRMITKFKIVENIPTSWKMLVICDNLLLIREFLELFSESNITIITNNIEVFRESSEQFKSYIYNDCLIFNLDKIENYDIVVDLIIFNKNNFQENKKIYADINRIIKRQKKVISLTYLGLEVEEIGLNLYKEIFITRINKSLSNTTASLRVGIIKELVEEDFNRLKENNITQENDNNIQIDKNRKKEKYLFNETNYVLEIKDVIYLIYRVIKSFDLGAENGHIFELKEKKFFHLKGISKLYNQENNKNLDIEFLKLQLNNNVVFVVDDLLYCFESPVRLSNKNNKLIDKMAMEEPVSMEDIISIFE